MKALILTYSLLLFTCLNTSLVWGQENARPAVLQNFKNTYGEVSTTNLSKMVSDFYPNIKGYHIAAVLDTLNENLETKLDTTYINLLFRLEQKYFRYSYRFMNASLLNELDSLVPLLEWESKRNFYTNLLVLNKAKNKFYQDHNEFIDVEKIESLTSEVDDSLAYLKYYFLTDVALERNKIKQASSYFIRAQGHSKYLNLSPREKLEKSVINLRVNAANLSREEVEADFDRLYKDLKFSDDLLELRSSYGSVIGNEDEINEGVKHWLYIFNTLVTLEREEMTRELDDYFSLNEKEKAIENVRLEREVDRGAFITNSLLIGSFLLLGLGALFYFLLRNRNPRHILVLLTKSEPH